MMKYLILLVLFSAALAIPRRAGQIAQVYPDEVYELSEASELQPETYASDFDTRFGEPEFSEFSPADELVPVDEVYPVDETSVDEIFADESLVDTPVEEDPTLNSPDEVYPEENDPEAAVDPTNKDDSFIYIRYPLFTNTQRNPFLRINPVFQWENSGVNDESLFVRPQSRRQSLFHMLFPELTGQFDTRSPSVSPESEQLPKDHQSNHGFHTVFNNFFDHPRERQPNHGLHHVFNTFFNQPRIPVMPSFEFDHSAHPGNYSNTTHTIHEVNGTKFAINETVNKNSGDNFHNFFHVRVIQHVPDVPTIEEESVPSRGDTVDTVDTESAVDTVPNENTDDTTTISDVGLEPEIPAEDTNELPKLPENFDVAENEVISKSEIKKTSPQSFKKNLTLLSNLSETPGNTDKSQPSFKRKVFRRAAPLRLSSDMSHSLYNRKSFRLSNPHYQFGETNSNPHSSYTRRSFSFSNNPNLNMFHSPNNRNSFSSSNSPKLIGDRSLYEKSSSNQRNHRNEVRNTESLLSSQEPNYIKSSNPPSLFGNTNSHSSLYKRKPFRYFDHADLSDNTGRYHSLNNRKFLKISNTHVLKDDTDKNSLPYIMKWYEQFNPNEIYGDIDSHGSTYKRKSFRSLNHLGQFANTDSPLSSYKKKSFWLSNPPDLSRDTKVNRAKGTGRKQNFNRIDPEAEVFNFNYVLREERGKNE